MSICPIHNLEYSYTCNVCEEELRYHSGGLDAFRAGFENRQVIYHDLEDQAAYANGKEWHRRISKRA
jgi:hypothetical protein